MPSNLDDALERMIERLLRKRKRGNGQHLTTQPGDLHQAEFKRGASFEPLEDWQWNYHLQKSFREMKLKACRKRLLPHLPVFPKLRVADRGIISLPVPDNNRKSFKPDPRTLSRFCFLKRKLSDEELNLLCNARAEWDEFDRAYPLAEEFVKIVRGCGDVSIELWAVRAFNPGVKELKSFANGLQKDFLAVKEAAT